MHLFASWCFVVLVSLFMSCSSRPTSSEGDESVAGGTAGMGQNEGGAGGDGCIANGEGGCDVSGSGGTTVAVSGGKGGAQVVAGSGGSGGAAGSLAGGAGGKAESSGGAPMGGSHSAECTSLPNCDGFETYSTSARPAGPWTGFEVTGGTLAVDETRGFGGSKKSVKITVNPGGEKTARMRHVGAGLLPADQIYMRMMVWMDAAPQGAGHWNWMLGEGNATQATGGKLSSAFIASGGNLTGGSTWMLYGGGASGGYQDCFAAAQTKLPTGRWACYEFHLNSKTNTGQSWVDGKFDELLAFEDAQPLTGQCLGGHNFTNGLWYVPRIEKVFFGFKIYHTLNATATAWIDDVAIGNKRIGCPGPTP